MHERTAYLTVNQLRLHRSCGHRQSTVTSCSSSPVTPSHIMPSLSDQQRPLTCSPYPTHPDIIAFHFIRTTTATKQHVCHVMTQPQGGPLMQVSYKGSLSRLRSLPCPDPETSVEKDLVLPRNHLLIVDHKTLVDTFASILSAITLPATGTHIIVPELAVDCLDVDDKDGRRGLEVYRPGDAGVQHRITVKVHHNLKQLLLDAKENGISFQRADQYDFELIREHKLAKKSYDLRLMVACASHFQHQEQREGTRRTVVLVSNDADVAKFGETCGVKVKSMTQLLMGK